MDPEWVELKMGIFYCYMPEGNDRQQEIMVTSRASSGTNRFLLGLPWVNSNYADYNLSGVGINTFWSKGFSHHESILFLFFVARHNQVDHFFGIYPPEGYCLPTVPQKILRLSAFFSSFVELCRGYVAWHLEVDWRQGGPKHLTL